MKPTEKFKPGTLIKPKKILWEQDTLRFNPIAEPQIVGGNKLYKTQEREVGKIWVEDGYRYTLEHPGNLPMNWEETYLHNIFFEDVYMVVQPPKFCDVPPYFHTFSRTQLSKKPVTYLGMIVSFGESLWEIPFVVWQDSHYAMKLALTMELHEMFESPDPWFSLLYEQANDCS